MFFEDADATARYMRALGMQVAAPPRQRGFYWGARPPRIVVVERSVREQGCSPQITLRSLLVYHLLEAIDGRRRVAWIDQGLAAALSHDDEYQELARLNRRVMAGLAAGRTIGAVEFFTATTNRVWWKHMRHAELNHFAWGNQFAAQAWSVMEFVCGRGATPDRRQAFRACLTDAGRRRRPAEAIERHFCCSCDELLAKWRNWVESQGVGEHLLPPKHIADHLLAEPIARLDSPDALPGERVSAIRELGEGGYLLGADRLIAALHGDNPEIAAEAVWALESISGQVLGSSSGVWEEWWAGVEDGLPSSCRETVTA
jgi:hypothetical protein